MTTIAYRNGVMAADSRSSIDGRHLTRCKKIFRLNSGALLGTAGDDDCRDIIKIFDCVSSENDLPSRNELSDLKIEGSYLLVLPDETVWQIEIGVRDSSNTDEWYGMISQIMENYAAIGSGQEFAIGAFAVGATAKEAVSAAAIWDLASGPPVVCESLVADKPKRKKSK